jgi:HTH-type transcriptional regulator/antitoxin HigA
MTSKIKVINTDQDYKDALKMIEELMSIDPDPDSESGEKLNLLATLVQDYESRIFPKSLPDPIEAILFRMEQNKLSPNDLVPFIGSRSKVSEILSRKRPLTLSMIRSLETGLGIPAKVLLKKTEETVESLFNNWSQLALKEMVKRNYFLKETLTSGNENQLLENFFSTIGSPALIFGMLRQSSFRTAPTSDRYALISWAGYVIKKSKEINISKKYKDKTINLRFMQNLAKLSIEKEGPLLVQEILNKHGILLIIEPHFPKTYLDGATILINKENPVIGLTLRYDRLDNFWFTLMHELAHIALHFNQNVSLFYDELEGIKSIDIDAKEKEADELAMEALVPAGKWEVSPAKLIPSSMAANSLAKDLGVHIAIIAGKIRHDGNKYMYLNKIVNEARVRQFFSRK